MQADYIIVGSGINSLVCAALLGRKGRRVLVLERNDRPGGCVRSEELTLPGFMHDALSCWHPLFVTSPGYAVLREALERHGLEYCNTEFPAAVVRSDGSHFVMHKSRQKNIEAMNAALAGEGDRYAAAMSQFEQTLDLTFTMLGTELYSWATAKVLLKSLLRRGPAALIDYGASSLETARSWLESTFRSHAIRACIAPWTLHTGLGPQATGSAVMAKIIPFTLEVAGTPVVKGGSYRLVEAFTGLLREMGAEMLVNADVSRVRVSGGKAVGVDTRDGRHFDAAQGVICSVTPRQLYTQLLQSGEVPESITAQARSFRHGRACMQIHVALSAPPRWQAAELDKVALVHLADDVDSVSRAVNEAERGLLPAQGSFAIGQPSVLDPSRIPAGKGMLWIQVLDLPPVVRGDAAGLIDCPADGRWNTQLAEAYADRVMDRLAKHIPGLRKLVLARRVLSPADLEAINVNLIGGDPYGGDCALDQFLLWRPLRGVRNHQTPIQGLYHIGASTHPGAGLGAGSGYLLANRLK